MALNSKCRAKDPATCPHHGVNFITARIYNSFEVQGNKNTPQYRRDVKDYQHMIGMMNDLMNNSAFVNSCENEVDAKDLVVTLEGLASSKQEKYDMSYMWHLATIRIAEEFLYWRNPNRSVPPAVNYLDESQIMPELWETGYHNALAKFMVSHGHPVVKHDSMYNWEDYDMDVHVKKCGMVAINNIKETSWYEWGGTFASDDYDGTRYGIECYGQCNCGRFKGQLRYEGQMGEVIRTIARSIPLKKTTNKPKKRN